MKVEVIKGVSHSIELIHGETSVCITPDEAENLIAQLRAVVPAPADIQEDKAATDYYLNLPNSSYGEGGHLLPRSINEAFKAGIAYERERLMKEAEVVEGIVCGRVADHINIKVEGGDYLTPKGVMHILADKSKYEIGDKVKLIILK